MAPFEFHQIHCSDGVSDVDYDAEVRSALHTILWSQESNGARQLQIRILVHPFEFRKAQCSDRVSDVAMLKLVQLHDTLVSGPKYV